ncbi:MAG TPA: hypothetical protein VFK40_08840, partial [Nitrososphaeraceae archaeon]|nr:hypothetical protein [Nitrososphaeraceae archaeon]
MENNKDLSLGLIIIILFLFYIIPFTTSDAKYTNNSTNITAFFETADTLYSQKKYDEAIQY